MAVAATAILKLKHTTVATFTLISPHPCATLSISIEDALSTRYIFPVQ